MAEFCETCAKKLGIQGDNPPLFCEHCLEHFPEPQNKIQNFFKKLFTSKTSNHGSK